MDVQDLSKRGLKLRKEIFGNAEVEKRERAFGEFGEPLQHLINAWAYGEVWSRPGLSRKARSLAVVAINAAIDRPQELKVHVKGALANGCTPEEIREVLLLVAVYCGIPAANEAHRVALEAMDAQRGA